ncbi:uncharacterized protein TNCV_3912511 [Trichonephila clavipes]|nr:uncharacterized protein TNCV_3912511 [Trichonephila clavipes]
MHFLNALFSRETIIILSGELLILTQWKLRTQLWLILFSMQGTLQLIQVLGFSTRSSTPKAVQPLSDCERRKSAMERLKKQQIMIDGYQKYLAHTRYDKDETGIRSDIEKNLQETKAARDRLKRKNSKNNSDDFVFLSKTARPTTPTPVLEPIEVQNSYENLDQDPEISVPITTDIPAPPLPTPIFLKIKKNY